MQKHKKNLFISIIVLLMFCLTGLRPVFGQIIFDELKGKYEVGFKLVEEWDSTRIYGDGFRPMQSAIWFPTNTISNEELTVENMIRYGARSETLINDALQAGSEVTGFINSSHVESNKAAEYLKVGLGVSSHAIPNKGKFPIVLYAPGSSAQWYDNYLLCQILASHGYIVASIKSRSLKSPTMSMNWTGVNSQVRDLEFVLGKIYGLIGSDNVLGVNVIGRSWGAISGLIFAIENERIVRSIASLDGTLSYNAHFLLEESEYPNAEYVRRPLFLAVGKKRSESATPIDRKRYFEDVTFADAYHAEYEHMPHTAFGSYYLYYHYLLNKGIDAHTSQQLKDGYKNYIQHLLCFLNYYNDLAEDQLSSIDGDVFSIQFQKQSKNTLPDYQDFGYALEVKGVKAAADIYYHTKAIDSTYATTVLFNAGFMNATAYQFLSKGKVEAAILLLEVATDAFPDNSNLYDSYGEMLFSNKEFEKSLQAYEQSLRLNKGNQNAQEMIEKITQVIIEKQE